jgi:ketosteroid isomerase-like protein
MSEEKHKKTIRRIYAALSKGDSSVFSASVHPDYIWRLAGHGSWSKRFEGQSAVREQLLRPLYAQFSTTYTASAINLIADGDYVVAEVRGDVQTKRGERYNNEYCIVFRFADEKIVEVIEYCDTDFVERRIGSYTEVVNALGADAGGLG